MMTREHARRNAPLREVETYWHALCGPDTVPSRSRIDPRGIEGALEYAFLAERIAPGMAKIRVAGSHLSDLLGMEVSGMPLSSLFAPAARELLAQNVTQVFEQPAILRADLRGEDGFGKPALEGQLLLLPLRSDMGDISRALGCLITHGRIGRVPRRFVLGEITATAVFGDAARAPRPEMPGSAGPRMPAAPQSAAPQSATPLPESDNYLRPRVPRVRQFDEAATPFVGPRPTVGRPNLRIVVSNDD